MFEIAIPYFEKDSGLCALALKSIDRFVDKGLIAKIHLINNARNPDLGELLYTRDIAPALGGLADRTVLHPASRFGVEHNGGHDAYIFQQILKLKISEIIETQHYLLLDTKNHFIKPAGKADFFGETGKPLSHHVKHGGYLETCLKASLEFMGTEGVDPKNWALPTVTPYMMNTQTVKDLCIAIREKGYETLKDAFEANNKITEFLLYFAFIAKTTGVNAQYEIAKRNYATLFASYPQTDEAFDHVIGSTRLPEVTSFAVHSRRFAQLSDKERDKVISIWLEAGLFENRDACMDFIEEQLTINTAADLAAKETSDNKVRFGYTGRLFIENDSNGIMAQHRGERVLPEHDIQGWQTCLEGRHARCADKGITYAMLVAPDNYAIHREELAELDGPILPRPILQLGEALPADIRPVYPLAEMRAAGALHHVSYFNDSHWSGYGAYIAYKALMAQVGGGLDVLEDAQVEWFDKVGAGDLGDKFDPPLLGRYTECVVRKPQSRKIWNNGPAGVTNRGHMSLWKGTNTKAPRGLLFTDSYGWKIQRFLAEAFSSLFIVHSPLLEDDLIEQFAPEFIFTLMAERFMIKVPDDAADQTASRFAEEKSSGDDVFPDFESLLG